MTLRERKESFWDLVGMPNGVSISDVWDSWAGKGPPDPRQPSTDQASPSETAAEATPTLKHGPGLRTVAAGRVAPSETRSIPHDVDALWSALHHLREERERERRFLLVILLLVGIFVTINRRTT